ncbi:S8 family serine peptidase, partial [Lysobacter sp. 2RAB21]
GTTISGSENEIGLKDGTSMASPHHAGAALLVRQAQPTWTVAEVKSALMMTAKQEVFKEDSVTQANAFAMGAGRVQVDQAIKAGLVLNETTANY